MAVCALLVALGVSASTAHLAYLTVPFDNYGHPCGLDGYKDYPRLYFSPKNPLSFFCLRECPSAAGETTQCLPTGNTSTPVRPCPPAIPTLAVLQFCLPNVTNLTDIPIPGFQKLMNDTVTMLPLLGAAAAFSLVLGLAVLLVSRLCMGVFVWALLLLSFAVNLAVCLLSFLLAVGNETARSIIGWDKLPELIRQSDVMTGVAAVSLVLLIVQALLVCCFCDKIRVSIMILKGSA